MLSLLAKFRKDVSGASMVEYGLLVALIALVALAGVTTLGEKVNSTMSGAANKLPAAGP
jgi:pilus assembly protein Flp/PilA